MTDTRIDEGVLELSSLHDDDEIVVVTAPSPTASPTIDLRVDESTGEASETLFAVYESLSFSDVVVKPRDSDIETCEVQLHSVYSANVSLRIPFVVASSVCNAATAIVVARAGGIAVLPGHSGITAQAAVVKRVKNAHHGWIEQPVTLSHASTLAEAREVWQANEISGAPVVDDLGRLIGMLTKRDVRFCTDADATRGVRELMTKEPALVTAPVGTTLRQARELMRWNRYEKLPMVDPNGMLVALLTVRDLLSAQAYAQAATDRTGRLKCAASVGIGPDVVDRVGALVDAGVDAVVVDRPDGSFAGVAGAVERIRNACGSLSIVAGRPSTAEGIRALVDSGADAVNVGGAGRHGLEVPLLSTLFQAGETARQLGVPLIARGASGGPGDTLKALATGASAVEVDPSRLDLPASTSTPPIESLLEQMACALRSGMAAAGAADLATLRTTLELTRVSPRQ